MIVLDASAVLCVVFNEPGMEQVLAEGQNAAISAVNLAEVLAKAMLILEDWAHGQVFDPTEITNERGIVVEEWRGRKGAGDRMLNQWLPVALKDSRYAVRLPIGTNQTRRSERECSGRR